MAESQTIEPGGAERRPNRLALEKSPYLRQHAYNPVEWFPWGEEAFAKATREQKPIFLSVGYSTCHWCHVMEHESFENKAIAALLNEHFVPIKVDREERPDIDKVYMTALQAMGQNGGWPMSMFLTPELKPFYGGTYFPPETQYGRGGFRDILMRVHEVWEKERDRVNESAESILGFLKEAPGPRGEGGMPDATAVVETCFQQLRKSFDQTFGGFGGAPKFPRPVTLGFLLRYFRRTGTALGLDMTEVTLGRMAEGGIYDHVGGGFHRYSVDAEWRIPHFEKMLYDQAQLASVYLDLYRATGKDRYAGIVRDVLDYVLRDLAGPEGGFYSAEDADSPKPESPADTGEGAFYLWTKREVTRVLGAEDAPVYCFTFGIEEEGNALYDPQMEFAGKNILYVAHSLEESAQHFHLSEEEVHTLLVRSRERLAAERAKRPRPGLDDKVLTSWNALMISAYARAYQTLGDDRYRLAAHRAAEFLMVRLRDVHTGRLLRRFRDGEARFEGHLDDHAFLIEGLLDLYEAEHHARWLSDAVGLARTMVGTFWDEQAGGFFDTSGRDPSLLVRTKEQYDGAEPAGNAMAAMCLLRLAGMTDSPEWRMRAERTIAQARTVLQQQPMVMPHMVSALDLATVPQRQVFIAGLKGDAATESLFREVFTRYLPNTAVMFVDGGEEQEKLRALLPFAGSLSMVGGKSTAYVCEGYVCRLPTTDPVELGKVLDGVMVPGKPAAGNGQ